MLYSMIKYRPLEWHNYNVGLQYSSQQVLSDITSDNIIASLPTSLTLCIYLCGSVTKLYYALTVCG